MKFLLLLTFVAAGFALPQTKPRAIVRVVGGEPTTVDKYPYMTSFLTKTYSSFYHQACGGSLITVYTILSAAHCFYRERPSKWRVIIGSTYPTIWRPPYAVQLNPSLFTVHPGFSMLTLVNDIAVIRLATPAPLSSHVGQARIPGPNYSIPDGTPLTVVGWGAIRYGGPVPGILQHVQVDLINHDLCTERYDNLKDYYDVTENMVCAGILDVGDKDACQGDSGGPLVHDGDVVFGITSWGFECADAHFPGVNTRVSAYRYSMDLRPL